MGEDLIYCNVNKHFYLLYISLSNAYKNSQDFSEGNGKFPLGVEGIEGDSHVVGWDQGERFPFINMVACQQWALGI